MSGKEQCPVPAVQKAEPNKTLPNATLAGENCAPELGGFDFAEVEAPNGDSLAAALGVLLAAPPEDTDPAQFENAAQSSIDAYPLPFELASGPTIPSGRNPFGRRVHTPQDCGGAA
jgi:hypothetical protein